ncbi:MAG: hypothetical protein WBB00_25205 [Mycobacterium sp.]
METWPDLPEQRRDHILILMRQRVADRYPFVDVDDLDDAEVVRLLAL